MILIHQINNNFGLMSFCIYCIRERCGSLVRKVRHHGLIGQSLIPTH